MKFNEEKASWGAKQLNSTENNECVCNKRERYVEICDILYPKARTCAFITMVSIKRLRQYGGSPREIPSLCTPSTGNPTVTLTRASAAPGLGHPYHYPLNMTQPQFMETWDTHRLLWALPDLREWCCSCTISSASHSPLGSVGDPTTPEINWVHPLLPPTQGNYFPFLFTAQVRLGHWE